MFEGHMVAEVEQSDILTGYCSRRRAQLQPFGKERCLLQRQRCLGQL